VLLVLAVLLLVAVLLVAPLVRAALEGGDRVGAESA
jgi:hypothetical protein